MSLPDTDADKDALKVLSDAFNAGLRDVADWRASLMHLKDSIVAALTNIAYRFDVLERRLDALEAGTVYKGGAVDIATLGPITQVLPPIPDSPRGS